MSKLTVPFAASGHLHRPGATSANLGSIEAAGRSGRIKWASIGVGIGGGITSAALLGSSMLAAYFARKVVTPSRFREEDLAILAVPGAGEAVQIILPANEDTTVPGTYSLYFDGGRGHARIGAIRSHIRGEDTVEREVEEVYSGDLSTAARGWWSGTVYGDPAAMGAGCEEVHVPVEGGSAPAWFFPAPQGSSTWAIMVHGRGANRDEGLRAVLTATKLGLNSLLISYRNDGDAPAAEDGRYGLGMTEWCDVEAAIEFALAKGAHEVLLFGWSMGGAICLQTADLSEHRDVIKAMVLDGPVVNWIDVLAHQARRNNIPPLIGRLGQLLLSHPWARSLTGLAAPVDLKSMDWVSRSDELRVPTLILHSKDDEFVPSGPSAELARRNPRLVSFVEFSQARHTKEWNVDPEHWDIVVQSWLNGVLGGMPVTVSAL